MAVELGVFPDGPESMVVSGALPSSIVHVRLAGGSSTIAYRLVAWTSNVCSRYGVAPISIPASSAAV